MSMSVGAKSSKEHTLGTVPGAMSGPAITSGTRAERSKNDILNQAPLSPSMSPWSLVAITTVSSAWPVSSRAPSSAPSHESK